MDMFKQNWSDISNEPISVEAIRALYVPSEAYRVSPNKYEAGVRCTSRAGLPHLVYVLDGCCKYQLGDRELTLCASEFTSLVKGEYWFEVMGDTEVKLVRVFQIPRIIPIR